MKFLHTSDWHLGRSENETSLTEDQIFFIDEICRIAEEKDVQAVLIAGDVYDRSVSSRDAISVYNYAMTKLCKELKKKVLVIAGNHDGPERLANLNTLLADSGLHVTGIAKKECECVRFSDAQVFMLPWITESKVKSLYPEESDKITSLSEAYRVYTGHIKEQFEEGKRHILLAHAFIQDSETSDSDTAAIIGTASQVGSDVFRDFDYVALGHIHKPQDVTDKIRYSGTPMPYSFGKEEKQVKSVTVIDTEDMSREIIPLPQLHTRRTFSDTYDNLLNPACSEEEKNGYVRLEITDIFAGLNAISQLRMVYPRIVDIKSRNFADDNSSINMTMEEFEHLQNDPREIFRHFCEEVAGEQPSDHFMEMFRNAIEETEGGNI